MFWHIKCLEVWIFHYTFLKWESALAKFSSLKASDQIYVPKSLALRRAWRKIDSAQRIWKRQAKGWHTLPGPGEVEARGCRPSLPLNCRWSSVICFFRCIFFFFFELWVVLSKNIKNTHIHTHFEIPSPIHFSHFTGNKRVAGEGMIDQHWSCLKSRSPHLTTSDLTTNCFLAPGKGPWTSQPTRTISNQGSSPTDSQNYANGGKTVLG